MQLWLNLYDRDIFNYGEGGGLLCLYLSNKVIRDWFKCLESLYKCLNFRVWKKSFELKMYLNKFLNVL